MKLEKDLPMSDREKEMAEQAILEYKKDFKDNVTVMEDSNPFWFYQPTKSDLSDDQRHFLSEFLRPEDIPSRLDSAVDVHACDANIVGVSGGNQSSKTTTCTIEDLIKATRKIPDSLKGIYPESKLPKKEGKPYSCDLRGLPERDFKAQSSEPDALDSARIFD